MPARDSLARVPAALCALVLAGRTAVAQPPSASRAAPAVAGAASEVPDSVIRRAVAEHFPTALSGAMGPRPFLWILADGQDRVLRSASGRDGLSRRPTGEEALDWGAAARKLPGMPRAARPGDLLQLGFLAAGADTVAVAWVRLQAGLSGR
jgi:hypothetical protein